MALPEHWGAILIALISGTGTILVTVLKMRGDKDNGIPGAYQGLMQEMKAWTGMQLEQRDRQIAELQEDVHSLRESVSLWRRKFSQAVAYIRNLRAMAPDREALPPVPEPLRDDIDV